MKENNHEYVERKRDKRDIFRFKYIFGNNISGNMVQFRGGSQSGIWSVILSKISSNLTIVDYLPPMIKVIKKNIKIK